MLSLFKKTKKQSSKQESTTILPTIDQQVSIILNHFEERKINHQLLNILFIFAILSFFATGSHKISPATYHLAKRESRQGTWTRGKGVLFLLKLGRSGV